MEKIRMNYQVKKNSFVIFIAFVTANVDAHDTTHIHPLITSKIADLIETSLEADAYKEIFIDLPDDQQDDTNPVRQRLYWGTDFDPVGLATTSSAPQDYLSEDHPGAYNRYNNVIDGVVQEDVPFYKVKDHFYHAETGNGLQVGGVSFDPSSIRAMRFFNESIDLMGSYSEEAKGAAFFTFGQALHHVEDMSSPAHVHNDAHLTVLPFEKDDYEGYYLPQQKSTALGANLSSLFASAGTVKDINNPWVDIWNVVDENSMVNYFHSKTTYNATLEFPLSGTIYNPSLVGTLTNSNHIVVTDALAPSLPQGELAEMFPCENELTPAIRDTTVESCLHWEEDELFEPAHWVINAVGKFQHQYRNGTKNHWWPVESEADYVKVSADVNPFSKKQYYLEQIIKDNNGDDPLGTLVIPTNIRADFNELWNSVSNATIVNAQEKSIPELYATHLLSPAVEFGAGFTQYWFDIANTPPYLISVTATQKPDISDEAIKNYFAEWEDDDTEVRYMDYQSVTSCTVLDSDSACAIKKESIVDIKVRNFTRSIVSHIDANEGLELKLMFNEPIKQVTMLRIGEFNESGGCVSPVNGCVDITPDEPVDGEPPANVIFGDLEDLDDRSNDKIWNITVPKTGLSNLNGKLVLTVKATDKNKHRNGGDITRVDFKYGGELDATPETPARRNTRFAMESLTDAIPVNYYPWYKEGVDNETPEDVDYSYDFEDGDQNHVLIFDTKGPDATIDLNL